MPQGITRPLLGNASRHYPSPTGESLKASLVPPLGKASRHHPSLTGELRPQGITRPSLGKASRHHPSWSNKPVEFEMARPICGCFPMLTPPIQYHKGVICYNHTLFELDTSMCMISWTSSLQICLPFLYTIDLS